MGALGTEKSGMEIRTGILNQVGLNLGRHTSKKDSYFFSFLKAAFQAFLFAYLRLRRSGKLMNNS